MSNHPNFLYIMTDQHRSDWLGCAGHPVVKTPNIDKLSEAGTHFTDFHAACPVCMPNRASFMTGRMPSVHGLRYNGCTLPSNANTFVDVLASAGYDTASIGKSHLQTFTGQPARHLPTPYDEARLIEEAWKTAQDRSEEAANNFEGDYHQPKLPYFGFKHVELVTQHGDRCGGHYKQWLGANVPNWKDLWNPKNELPHNYSCPQAYRTPVPEEIYPTAWIADRAIDYLSDPARVDAPFFAYVSFPDPHHPFNPPGKYWDMYAPDQFELDLPYEAHRNPPPPLAWMEADFHHGGSQATKQTAMRVKDQGLKEAMALTAGMITMIDDQVGRLIETLKKSGLYENTVIVFNADHGDYLGDYGLLLKGGMPSRALTQVPMIWSDPLRRTGSQNATLASTVDIGPTILDRAGLAPYHGMQGRSFLGAVHGESHRDSLLIEYNDNLTKYGFPSPARVRTIRTKDWRMSLYAGQKWGELYHVRDDPKETHNLWGVPEHADTQNALVLSLAHELVAQMDESPRSLELA